MRGEGLPRRALVLVVALSLIVAVLGTSACSRPMSESDKAIAAAYASRTSGIQVTGEGRVTRILTDDMNGDRHQRFILELESGQTLLISHNIDIAPRIDTLSIGDSVRFNGVYEWNSEGGVVHWTHHDPGGSHEPGWLDHAGLRYQ